MANINEYFYVSLVVRKMRLFVGSPNFQRNNFISVLSCSCFLANHQFFVYLLWNNLSLKLLLIFYRSLYNVKVILDGQCSLWCP